MIEKIVLFLSISTFIILVIIMARVNEQMSKKDSKFTKGFYKDLHVPALNAIFFPLRVFFLDLDKKDRVLKK